MKNKFSIFLLLTVIATFAVSFFVPDLAHAHIPFITDHAGYAAGLPMLARGVSSSGQMVDIMPPDQGTRSIAKIGDQIHGIKTGIMYKSDGSEKATVRVVSVQSIPLNFSATFTITAASYVANGAIPFIPRLTSDALPAAGVAFACRNFGSFTAFAAFYGAGVKKALIGDLRFNAQNDSMYGTMDIIQTTYNDAGLAGSPQVTNVKNVATYLPDQFDLKTRWWVDSEVLTGDVNNGTAFSFASIPDATDTITCAYFVKDSEQGATVSKAVR